MTVTELREALQKLEAQGKGALEVLFNDSDYGWDRIITCRVVDGHKNRLTDIEAPRFAGLDSVG